MWSLMKVFEKSVEDIREEQKNKSEDWPLPPNSKNIGKVARAFATLTPKGEAVCLDAILNILKHNKFDRKQVSSAMSVLFKNGFAERVKSGCYRPTLKLFGALEEEKNRETPKEITREDINEVAENAVEETFPQKIQFECQDSGLPDVSKEMLIRIKSIEAAVDRLEKRDDFQKALELVVEIVSTYLRRDKTIFSRMPTENNNGN